MDAFWRDFFSKHRRALPDAPAQGGTPALHPRNQTGYFGDLLPFFHREEDTLYLYYMTGDVTELTNAKIEYHLATSRDLFNFQEQPFEIKPFVTDIVNLPILKPDRKDILDFHTFPEGTRDTYFFFDRQLERYRYIGLSYYAATGRIKCALSTAVSDDAKGEVWTTPARVLQNYPVDKAPECPWAMWINDRWYVGCSLWGMSDHNVGRFRYYIGDVGKGIDQQDWLLKQAHFLDGEDWCATQVVDVGGRYLLYGWIVKCYEKAYFPAKIDNGLWGGDVNLPRELYQLGDGTLGARLPEPLKRMIRKQRLACLTDFSPGEGGRTLAGPFGASCLTVKAELSQARRLSLTLTSQGKAYEIRIAREHGWTRLTISCRADTAHPVASSCDIPRELRRVDAVIVAEGNLLEVFINDTYVLSARTSMFSGVCDSLTLSAQGVAQVAEWAVYRLAHSGNLYE